MASSSSLLLMISLLAVLPFLSYARPCKTLFFAYTISSENIQISTTTTTSSSSGDVDPTQTRLFSVYRVISPFPFIRSDGGAHPDLNHPSMVGPTEVDDEGFMGMTPSSLQERARDILVVVAGLLFGVGCGAITAATIYLAWSLLTNQYHPCGSHNDDEDEDDFKEYASDPSKLGYVKVVDVETAAKTTVPPVAKEGYEG